MNRARKAAERSEADSLKTVCDAHERFRKNKEEWDLKNKGKQLVLRAEDVWDMDFPTSPPRSPANTPRHTAKLAGTYKG